MCYYVKETALSFASFEADTEAITWFSGNEASDVIDQYDIKVPRER